MNWMAATLALMCLSVSTQEVAQTLGSNSQVITVGGKNFGIDWSVNQSGPLVMLSTTFSHEGNSGFNEAKTWDATRGGCAELSEKYQLNMFPSILVWVEACSRGVICRTGLRVIDFEARVWMEVNALVLSNRLDQKFINQEFFPSGPCS
ncbi:MAG TPA: hypothetical protein VK148_02145 [Xanthobacteraceae bacterium]|jgi:hypothetical protein|nr:hypothetical protein [Xanthobacteraceae bacterium]